MNTIKLYLAESGRIADLHKDFPLYQGQFQDKLLNVFVPTSILAPQFEIQHYIGQISGAVAPSDEELDAFVLSNTYPHRESAQGDIIEFFNTTDVEFFIYTFNGSEWESTQVDSFGTITNIAGTSIKIGMTAVKRNGSIYESKSYFMRYLKTLTYQGVEYALYERKLPKEFTLFVGQGLNAPIMIANVVNIDTETKRVLSIVTSQTCQFDVMTSTMLDGDETIEASDLENLQAQVNENSAEILLKQDKIDDNLLTTQKSVVGAINEVKNTADTNTINIQANAQDISDIKAEQITQNEGISSNSYDIAQNTGDIVSLSERVSIIEQQVVTEETYIGKMTGSELPTNTELDDFVFETVGRQPNAGDTIIFVLEKPNATDENYKYIYSATSQWTHFEIPPTEPASNTSLGIIKGTYNSSNNPNTQVNIVNGEISEIYVVDVDGNKRTLPTLIREGQTHDRQQNSTISYNYQMVREHSGKISTLETSVGNILNGSTSVPKATSAVNDNNGNEISTTYLTNVAGVTKTQMRDYALPRSFNDVNFLTSTGFSGEIPDGQTPIYSVTTDAVDDFELFSAEKTITNATFQLANKNSYTDTIFASASINCTVQFRLTTEIYVNSTWETANIELTEEIGMVANQIKKLSFASTFNSLEEVFTLTDNDKIRQTLEVITQTSSEITFSIYSNDVYPSTFYLNTTSQTIVIAQGKLGELPVYNLIGTSPSANVIDFEIPSEVNLYDNVEALFVLNYSSTFALTDTVQLSHRSQTIQIVTPFNNGTNNSATFNMLRSKYAPNANKWVFSGVFKDNNGVISVIADIDDVQSAIDIDATPTQNSINPVSSGGVYAKLQNISNPNLLINGDFQVNQRGETTYLVNEKYTLDRWVARWRNKVSVLSKGIRLELNPEQSGQQHIALNQTIENHQALYGKTLTASVKVLAVNTTTSNKFVLRATAANHSYTNTDNIVEPTEITGAGIYTLTFDFNDTDMTGYSCFNIGVYCHGYAGDYIDIEWVKLEVGSVATPFSPKTYAQELLDCQRYFFEYACNIPAIAASDSYNLYPPISLPTKLRINSPTLTITTPYVIRGEGSQISGNPTITFSTNNNQQQLELKVGGLGSVLTTYKCFSTHNGTFTLDAEIY